MIIDSHFHLLDEGWVHRDFLIGSARLATAPMGKLTGEYPDPAALVDNLMPLLADSTGEKRVATLDAAGVDRSLIFTVDSPC